MDTFLRDISDFNSRAFCDDDDDYEDEIATRTETDINQPTTVIQWCEEFRENIASAKHLPITKMIIAVGLTASSFTATHIKGTKDESKIVGTISILDPTVETATFRATQTSKSSCLIYCLKKFPEVLVVEENTRFDDKQSFAWVERLFESLQKERLQVFLLATGISAEYKCDQSPGTLVSPFLRALKTSNWTGREPGCEYLKQPNIAVGLPAQILTYCQIRQIPAVLYVCYTDYHSVDIKAVRLFLKEFVRSDVDKLVVENVVEAGQKLVEIVQVYENLSSLYT